MHETNANHRGNASEKKWPFAKWPFAKWLVAKRLIEKFGPQEISCRWHHRSIGGRHSHRLFSVFLEATRHAQLAALESGK